MSTARSGRRRSWRITSATHHGGSAAASWAAAAITEQTWLSAVCQAAAVSWFQDGPLSMRNAVASVSPKTW